MEKTVLGKYVTPESAQEAKRNVRLFLHHSLYWGLNKTKREDLFRYASDMLADMENGCYNDGFSCESGFSRYVIYNLIGVCCQYGYEKKGSMNGEDTTRLNRSIMLPIEGGLFDSMSFNEAKGHRILELGGGYFSYIQLHKDILPRAASVVESFTDYLSAELRRIERNETGPIGKNGKPYGMLLLEIFMRIKKESQILIVPQDTQLKDCFSPDNNNFLFEIDIRGYRKDPHRPACFVKEPAAKTRAYALVVSKEQKEQMEKYALPKKEKCIFQHTNRGALVGKIFC